MHVSKAEQEAVNTVCGLGSQFGYGNMIAHIATAWTLELMQRWGLPEESARLATENRSGYPLQMHKDIRNGGTWDETGKRYKE